MAEKRRNPLPEVDLLTKKEVAAALRVSPRTVERLVRSGRLPVFEVAESAVRFHRADVLAFVKANTVRKAPPKKA